MGVAVKELFDGKGSNTPVINLIRAPLLGIEPGSSYPFSVVQCLVNSKFSGWATAVGYFEDDKSCLCPGVHDLHEYGAETMIIIFERSQKAQVSVEDIESASTLI